MLNQKIRISMTEGENIYEASPSKKKWTKGIFDKELKELSEKIEKIQNKSDSLTRNRDKEASAFAKKAWEASIKLTEFYELFKSYKKASPRKKSSIFKKKEKIKEYIDSLL